MNDKQGAVLMAAVLFVLWLLFSPVKQEQQEVQPTDGLIEQLQVASESLEESNRYPEEKQQPAKKPEIVIFTRPNCPPCDRWKQIEQPKFEKAGWVVAYCDQHNFALTPHFILEANGRAYENKGYLPFEKIDEVTK